MSTRSLIPVLAALLLGACSETDPLVAPPERLPRLADATWYVHTSDDQPLPALIGHRTLEGNVLEQDILDSTKLEITAGGTWQQLAWYHRFRSGTVHSWRTAQDHGYWTATDSTYEFYRHTGELLHTLDGPPGQELRLNLRYTEQPGVAVSVLRTTPPAPVVFGRWRAVALRDVPLPATYFVEPDFQTDSNVVSRHIVVDSSFVVLYANGTYGQRIYYSEWEGPAFGAKQTFLRRAMIGDLGSWQRDGLALSFASGWFQYRTMLGQLSAPSIAPITIAHGIGHGDEPAPFRYERW